MKKNKALISIFLVTISHFSWCMEEPSVNKELSSYLEESSSFGGSSQRSSCIFDTSPMQYPNLYMLTPTAPTASKSDTTVDPLVTMFQNAVMKPDIKEFEMSLSDLQKIIEIPELDKRHKEIYKISIAFAIVNTPKLSLAAKKLKYLFEHCRIDPAQLDENGNTLIHIIAGSNPIFNEEIASLILEKANIINTLNKNGETPLHIAATRKIEFDTLQKTPSLSKRSPSLREFTSHKKDGKDEISTQVISFLLRKGANPTIKNNNGQDTLSLYKEKSIENYAKKLELMLRSYAKKIEYDFSTRKNIRFVLSDPQTDSEIEKELKETEEATKNIEKIIAQLKASALQVLSTGSKN